MELYNDIIYEIFGHLIRLAFGDKTAANNISLFRKMWRRSQDLPLVTRAYVDYFHEIRKKYILNFAFCNKGIYEVYKAIRDGKCVVFDTTLYVERPGEMQEFFVFLPRETEISFRRYYFNTLNLFSNDIPSLISKTFAFKSKVKIFEIYWGTSVLPQDNLKFFEYKFVFCTCDTYIILKVTEGQNGIFLWFYGKMMPEKFYIYKIVDKEYLVCNKGGLVTLVKDWAGIINNISFVKPAAVIESLKVQCEKIISVRGLSAKYPSSLIREICNIFIMGLNNKLEIECIGDRFC